MRRLSFLDSIRGLAALAVVLSHIHLTIPTETSWLDLPVICALDDGVFAVALFFTLSGFVLSLQLKREKAGYLPFLIRRTFRLFPASVIAVTISYSIYALWHPEPSHLGAFFNRNWPPGLTFVDYLENLPLFNNASLLRPMWSLVHEWRVSLIFPFLFFLVDRYPKFCAIGIFIIGFELAGPLVSLTVDTQSIFTTILFLSCFISGIVLAKYWRSVVLFSRTHRATQYVVAVPIFYYLAFRPFENEMVRWVWSALISGLLITFCICSSKVRFWLRRKIPRMCGEVSYSLYLIHMIWLCALFRIMDGSNPLLISGCVIALSLASAKLMQLGIEQPFNRLGRLLSRSSPRFVSLQTEAIASTTER